MAVQALAHMKMKLHAEKEKNAALEAELADAQDQLAALEQTKRQSKATRLHKPALQQSDQDGLVVRDPLMLAHYQVNRRL